MKQSDIFVLDTCEITVDKKMILWTHIKILLFKMEAQDSNLTTKQKSHTSITTTTVDAADMALSVCGCLQN